MRERYTQDGGSQEKGQRGTERSRHSIWALEIHRAAAKTDAANHRMVGYMLCHLRPSYLHIIIIKVSQQPGDRVSQEYVVFLCRHSSSFCSETHPCWNTIIFLILCSIKKTMSLTKFIRLVSFGGVKDQYMLFHIHHLLYF